MLKSSTPTPKKTKVINSSYYFNDNDFHIQLTGRILTGYVKTGGIKLKRAILVESIYHDKY